MALRAGSWNKEYDSVSTRTEAAATRTGAASEIGHPTVFNLAVAEHCGALGRGASPAEGAPRLLACMMAPFS